MAIAQEPNKWSMPLGANADANTIPDTAPESTGAASMNSVFPQITQVPLEAGGIAPTRADFNGLFKLLGDSIYYLQRGGIFSYADTVDYPAGAVVKSSNGIYIAIQANGPASTVAGPSNTNYWRRLTTTVNNQYADASGNVTLPLNFLPLTGGTLAGNIATSGNIYKTSDTTQLTLAGGTSYSNGSSLVLRGKENSSGGFSLTANDGSTTCSLTGMASGSLVWSGKNIVRSINNTNADQNGNVSITSVTNATNATNCPNYLPLTGGQMSGSILTSANNLFFNVCSGTSNARGAALSMWGDEYGYTPDRGKFSIAAQINGRGFSLLGAPDGSLTWGNKGVNVIERETYTATGTNVSCGIRYTNGLQICWGGRNNANESGIGKQGVVFAYAFNNTKYVVMTSCLNVANYFINTATKNSGSGITVGVYQGETPTSNAVWFDYIAIGTWK